MLKSTSQTFCVYLNLGNSLTDPLQHHTISSFKLLKGKWKCYEGKHFIRSLYQCCYCLQRNDSLMVDSQTA